MTFPGSIQKDRGQPSLVRMGIIDAEGQVTLQGVALDVDTVGILGSYAPVPGDTVAVLGQSAIGTAGASWLILGRAATSTANFGVVGRSLVVHDYLQSTSAFFFQGVTATIPNLTAAYDLPPGEYVVVVEGVADIECITVGPVAVVECSIDGGVQTAQLLRNPRAVADRGTFSQNWRTTVTLTAAGTLPIFLQARRVGGADNQLQGSADHCTMLVQIFR